jgi:hypothetical protein
MWNWKEMLNAMANVPQAFLFAHHKEDDPYPKLQGRLHNVYMVSIQRIDLYPNTIYNLIIDHHALSHEGVRSNLDCCSV